MQLSMTVLRCPDQVAPEARTVSGGEFNVGRGPDVDWVLPDPDRLLSKRHFAVAFRGGAWQVADTSTNGTYLNTEPDAIGRGAVRSLRDGDRLLLGKYEIEIHLADQPGLTGQDGGNGYAARPAGGSGPGGIQAGGQGESPFGDPFDDDPLAPPPPPRRAFDEPEYPDFGLTPTSARIPDDYDSLIPDHRDGAFSGEFSRPGYQAGEFRSDDFPGGGFPEDEFRGPVQSDHSSPMDDAVREPPIIGYSTPRSSGVIPADDLLPDNWDKELLEGIVPSQPPPGAPAASGLNPGGAAQRPAAVNAIPEPVAASPEPFDFLDPLLDPLGPIESPGAANPPDPAPPAPPVAAPVVRQLTPRPATPPAAAPSETDPFNELESSSARQQAEAPGQPLTPPAADMPRPPRDDAPLAPELAVEPARIEGQPASVADQALLAAFFKGAGLEAAVTPDPVAMMTELGSVFRAMIAGLRLVLIARAEIKSEFRIEQTAIQARGNNPLRFSANDDDALTALLGVGRHTDMGPAVAVEDSLRNIRLHEIAVMNAMQSAVRAMLDGLSPEKIRTGAEQGGMNVLPAQRKARAWDAYEARHAAVVKALTDDFDSIFGKSFARAYERAFDEISREERQ